MRLHHERRRQGRGRIHTCLLGQPSAGLYGAGEEMSGGSKAPLGQCSCKDEVLHGHDQRRASTLQHSWECVGQASGNSGMSG